MKLTGELKAKVESAEGMEEKKALIADAGMELTDKELASVAGGGFGITRIIHLIKDAPVFRDYRQPYQRNCVKTLFAGTDVTVDLNHKERCFAPDMQEYSPVLYITSPVVGWIPESAIMK